MMVDDEMLAVRAAELYYDENKTQDEIGTLLNLTRWKVGRLLSEARENGIIRIEIVHPRARRLSIERELREKTGLTTAIVVPGSGDDDDLQSRVALAAADYLTSLRPVPRTLGISWGRTLHLVAQNLRQGWATNVNVVQINGGVSLNKRSSSASNTAVTIAQRGGGSATLLPSPAILEREETKRAIESDRTVAGVLELGRAASAYLFSAGLATRTSVLVESGYLSADEVTSLVDKGAVGDVVGHYIDADGNAVDPSLERRTMGIGL
ncbi:sugar-binding transcriptional regulator [soil metagenome]